MTVHPECHCKLYLFPFELTHPLKFSPPHLLATNYHTLVSPLFVSLDIHYVWGLETPAAYIHGLSTESLASRSTEWKVSVNTASQYLERTLLVGSVWAITWSHLLLGQYISALRVFPDRMSTGLTVNRSNQAVSEELKCILMHARQIHTRKAYKITPED